MSDEEQDRVIGRLVRDAAQSKSKLAALQHEITRIAALFSGLSTFLVDFLRDPSKKPDSLVPDVPTTEAVIALLVDFCQEQERQSQLQSRLHMAGL